ncbi:MAG TPA: polysaccharide deacetylase family protein, partial [Nitrososphaeraceae archaeon]|nr:polysaccharide deacetylase family protein [Nitrososphaeraceae archaeon]
MKYDSSSSTTTAILVIVLLLTSSLLVVLSNDDTIAQAKKNLILTFPHYRHSASSAILSRSSKTIAKNTIPTTNKPDISSVGGNSSTNSSDKIVIINFDDSHKSQYTYAKPILDKYGFKATFFEVCNWVGIGHKSDMTMTWKDISALQQDGIDIEAHTMTHPHLNELSSSAAGLDYEIGQSKQCLADHGINSTIFAYPYGDGSNNSEVVNTVGKYYYLA